MAREGSGVLVVSVIAIQPDVLSRTVTVSVTSEDISAIGNILAVLYTVCYSVNYIYYNYCF